MLELPSTRVKVLWNQNMLDDQNREIEELEIILTITTGMVYTDDFVGWEVRKKYTGH